MSLGRLPMPKERPHAARPMIGSWRAIVEGTSPYWVSVPDMWGAGRVVGPVEVAWEVLNIAALTVGDRVWVTCIHGDSAQLLITGRRP